MAAIALADERPAPDSSASAALARKLGPTTRLAVTQPAATQPATRRVDVAPSSTRAVLPTRREIKAIARPLHEPLARVREMIDQSDRPAIAPMSPAALPSMPGFAEGPRLVVTPIAQAMPIRIPNLLISPKRAIYSSANPLMTPASPISTPTICNAEGTIALALMPPLTREIQIELTTLPAPLSMDEAPLLAVTDAPDDRDAPVVSNDVPGRARME